VLMTSIFRDYVPRAAAALLFAYASAFDYQKGICITR
jgi:hypothetical protein